MSTVFCWLFWIVVLTFVGYIVSRILFWTGAFIWQWSIILLFDGDLWFDEGTTIKDICNEIKYEDGCDHDGAYNRENYYTDSYSSDNMTKWVPGVNVIFAAATFCLFIIGFVLALFVGIIRLLVIFCRDILWPYFLKWICKGIIKIAMALCWILAKLRIVNFYFYLKKIYQKAIYNLLHLRIA
jgi:hypothetical protein